MGEDMVAQEEEEEGEKEEVSSICLHHPPHLTLRDSLGAPVLLLVLLPLILLILFANII